MIPLFVGDRFGFGQNVEQVALVEFVVQIFDFRPALLGVELQLPGDQRNVDTLIELGKADVQKVMCCLQLKRLLHLGERGDNQMDGAHEAHQYELKAFLIENLVHVGRSSQGGPIFIQD